MQCPSKGSGEWAQSISLSLQKHLNDLLLRIPEKIVLVLDIPLHT